MCRPWSTNKGESISEEYVIIRQMLCILGVVVRMISRFHEAARLIPLKGFQSDCTVVGCYFCRDWVQKYPFIVSPMRSAKRANAHYKILQ